MLRPSIESRIPIRRPTLAPCSPKDNSKRAGPARIVYPTICYRNLRTSLNATWSQGQYPDCAASPKRFPASCLDARHTWTLAFGNSRGTARPSRLKQSKYWSTHGMAESSTTDLRHRSSNMPVSPAEGTIITVTRGPRPAASTARSGLGSATARKESRTLLSAPSGLSSASLTTPNDDTPSNPGVNFRAFKPSLNCVFPPIGRTSSPTFAFLRSSSKGHRTFRGHGGVFLLTRGVECG